MIKNRILTKEIQSNSKKDKSKGLILNGKAREINEYENIIKNKKRIINMKIKEEEKNIEKSLTKLSHKINNINDSKLRNENQIFFKQYNQFSKKNFITVDSLVGDLSRIYSNKGYEIPNLNNNLFKINPLLENNASKMFLSNLFASKLKISNKKKLFNSNKSLAYLKKLEYLISPEKAEKNNKNKAPNFTQQKLIKKRKKIQTKSKNNTKSLIKSIKNLIKLINNNELSNIEDKSYFKTRNKTVFKKMKNEINYNILYNTVIIKETKTKIKNQEFNTDCSQNDFTNYYDTSINKKDSHKNSTLNHFFINEEKINNNDISYKNMNKTFYSSKKLEIPYLNALWSNESNNKINIKEKNSYLSKEKKRSKTNRYILITPNLLKNQSSSTEKSNNNTKAFSISNENNSLSYRTKNQNSKMEDSSSSKIKEFTINSYKNKFNSNRKISSRYTSSNNYNIRDYLKNNKKIPLEFRIKTPKKLFKNNDEKDNFVNKIYKKLNFWEVNDTKKNIKLYLSQMKQFNDKEINEIIEKYNYHNFNLNLQELQKKINEKEIEKKIFRLYLNNHDANRIEPLLKVLNEKDKQILQFDKKIAKISFNS